MSTEHRSSRIGTRWFVVATVSIIACGCRSPQTRDAISHQNVVKSRNALIDSILGNRVDDALNQISAGANVNTVDEYCGGSPLYYAVQRRGDMTTVVLSLLDHGADVNSPNKSGATPLHAACMYDHVFTVLLLISRGANVSARDLQGSTPLHIAAGSSNWDNEIKKTSIVRLLITKGASVNARDNIGRTPLDFAIAGGYGARVSILRSKDGRTGPEITGGQP